MPPSHFRPRRYPFPSLSLFLSVFPLFSPCAMYINTHIYIYMCIIMYVCIYISVNVHGMHGLLHQNLACGFRVSSCMIENCNSRTVEHPRSDVTRRNCNGSTLFDNAAVALPHHPRRQWEKHLNLRYTCTIDTEYKRHTM